MARYLLPAFALLLLLVTCVIDFALRTAAAEPPRAGSHHLVVALGDSITYGWGLPLPKTENYAALLARGEDAKLENLAVPGYTCADVAAKELPKMPPGASIVIINCGTNDIGGFGFTATGPDGHLRVPPATSTRLLLARCALAHILAVVRTKEPSANVVLLSVRHWERMTGREAPAFANDVNEWNAMLRSAGFQFIDINTDPRMYEARYIQQDLLHPTVAGNGAIAKALLQLEGPRERRK